MTTTRLSFVLVLATLVGCGNSAKKPLADDGGLTFDSSAGGLGGCPYAPGATGNLATEDLLYLLEGLGVSTGVSLAGIAEASIYLAKETGRKPPSRYLAARLGTAASAGSS